MHKIELAFNSAIKPLQELAANVERNLLTRMSKNVSCIPNCTQQVSKHIDSQAVTAGHCDCQAQLNSNELRLRGSHPATGTAWFARGTTDKVGSEEVHYQQWELLLLEHTQEHVVVDRGEKLCDVKGHHACLETLSLPGSHQMG